jgi:glucose/arabinose dehydrogenase
MSASAGWSCGDYPCEDDLLGWQARIRVSEGFALAYVGRFNGQVQQIALDNAGRLYATVLENGTRNGAVYRMNDDGTSTRLTSTLISPLGLAFQPGTDVLYVTARTTPLQGGALWRVLSDGQMELVRDDLPCCYMEIDNQPNGLLFGADGYLYVGVGSLTDRAESPNPRVQAYATLVPYEASILRVHPHTGELDVFATGIRNPYDIAQDSTGRFYATDTGTVAGIGDRLLSVVEGGNYGFPYYRGRGCEDCPIQLSGTVSAPDVLTFAPYTLPQGLVAYTGAQFPANMRDTLFVALWHQGVVLWVDPNDPQGQGVPFVTGLLRPSDVVVDVDGTLLIADWLYGQVWRVLHSATEGFLTPTPTPVPNLFVTSTPSP